jgi:hypothetical protein
MIKKFLKEPLVHFLLLGAFLFIVFDLVSPENTQDTKKIVVDAQEIKYIKDHFKKRFRRSPSEKELNILINDYIVTEAYYREAIKLGLDKNNHTVKKLLRKKMELMSKNVLSLLDITDIKLQKYLDEHKDEFIQDARFAFDQVQIDPNIHKNDLNKYLMDIKRQLDNGLKVKSDSAIVPPHFSNISKTILDGDFGKEFSNQLKQSKVGVWRGVIKSDLGLHFVKLIKYTPGNEAKLEKIKDRVTRAYIIQKQKQILDKQRKELVGKYEIIIDLNSSKMLKDDTK